MRLIRVCNFSPLKKQSPAYQQTEKKKHSLCDCLSDWLEFKYFQNYQKLKILCLKSCVQKWCRWKSKKFFVCFKTWKYLKVLENLKLKFWDFLDFLDFWLLDFSWCWALACLDGSSRASMIPIWVPCGQHLIIAKSILLTCREILKLSSTHFPGLQSRNLLSVLFGFKVQPTSTLYRSRFWMSFRNWTA